MSKLTADIPMGRIMSRQFRLWECAYEHGRIRSGKDVITPCITISKEEGAQGVELAQQLSKSLGWKVFDKSLVEFIAQNARVRQTMVEMFDEKVQDEINNWVATFLDKYALSSGRYLKHLMTIMLSISEHGHAIILGRGGNFIMPANKTLRICIVSSRAKKLLQISRKRKVSKAEAGKIIAQADKTRDAFIRRYFHHDRHDPLYYDLILNLDHLTISSARDIILSALKLKFPNHNNN